MECKLARDGGNLSDGVVNKVVFPFFSVDLNDLIPCKMVPPSYKLVYNPHQLYLYLA